MKEPVGLKTINVPNHCLSKRCEREGCKVHLDKNPNRLVVDLDCEDLGLISKTRCDYLLVSEERESKVVAPLELKGGKVMSVSHVARQLRGGAQFAANLLPQSFDFRFVPILAC